MQNTSSCHIVCCNLEQQYYQSRVEMDSRAVQLQSLEMERRKAAALAAKDFNLAMVSQRNCT